MQQISSYKIGSAFLKGEIKAPISKSVLQRVIAATFLARGESRIFSYTLSDDVDVALNIIKNLGADLSISKSEIIVKGGNWNLSHELNVGEAGLSTRMFTPIAALSGREIKFVGEGSILKRPMDFMVKPLAQFGVELQTNNSFLPFTINGKLHGAEAFIDGSKSSQLLTGLLMALPLAEQNSLLHVQDLKSIPYIELTLDIMKQFGVYLEHDDFKVFRIKGNQHYNAIDFTPEGDWSGAAFWFVAAAINGDIQISGLKSDSKQADIQILNALSLANVNFTYKDGQYQINKSAIKAFEFDATHCPDLFPPLVVLAAYAEGKSRILGVERLFQKESNRALALQTEFQKQGIRIEIVGNEMIIQGGRPNGGQVFSSYNDHRMAMAGAILAQDAKKPIEINNVNCVSKSYPKFYDDLFRLTSF